MIKAIEIKTASGICDAWMAQPEGGGPWPGIVFCMDAIGPRPILYAMAERLASNGYVVLLPNLFYRGRPAPIVSGVDFPVALNSIPEVLKQIMPLVERFDSSAAILDMEEFLRHLSEQPIISAGKFGIFGYCMGGAIAIRAAVKYPDRFGAVASFHAGGLVSQSADSPHRLLSQLKAALYVGHADEDPHMSAEQIVEFGEAASTLSVPHRLELYVGAHHHFTIADLPAYDVRAAEKHWDELIRLFDHHLK